MSASFQPDSVSFVSLQEGFVLGRGRCASGACTAIARTEDGGASWRQIAAPGAELVANRVGSASQAAASEVSEIRFADPLDGWVFGPALWATHDGGRDWHPVALPGRLLGLAASDGTAYAVVTQCGPSASCSGNTTLFRSPASQDRWEAVPGVMGAGWGTVSEPVVLHGSTGYVALGSSGTTTALFGTTDGTTWRRLSDPCAIQAPRGWWMTAIATPDGSTLYELCQGSPGAGSALKRLYRSTDGGVSTTLVGTPGPAGDSELLAVATPDTVALGTWSGDTWIELSNDAGRTFRNSAQFSGGPALFDLGFTSASQGIAIVGGPGLGEPDELLMTHDAGASWAAVVIR